MRAIGVRTLCHGRSGTARPRRSATRRQPRRRRGPYDDPSPTGPPSCTGSESRSVSKERFASSSPTAPATGDGGEGRRHGELAERAPDHRRRAVGFVEAEDRGGGVAEPLGGQRRGAADDDHRRRVEDVLTGCPAMDVLGDLLDRRSCAVARRGRSPARRAGRLPGRGLRCRCSRRGRRRRLLRRRRSGIVADVGVGGGERRLDVELRLEPRRRRSRLGHRAAGDEMGERIAHRIARHGASGYVHDLPLTLRGNRPDLAGSARSERVSSRIRRRARKTQGRRRPPRVRCAAVEVRVLGPVEVAEGRRSSGCLRPSGRCSPRSPPGSVDG